MVFDSILAGWYSNATPIVQLVPNPIACELKYDVNFRISILTSQSKSFNFSAGDLGVHRFNLLEFILELTW